MAVFFSERELKFMFAIMSSAVRLSSVVCLSVVCNVGAPYSDDWNFGNVLRYVVPFGHP